MQKISQLDRFDASWTAIERREGKTLNQLKSIATVRSVGASTRIEGSKMTNEEVEVLIRNISISKLEERDQQEVAGYFEALELITESYREISITVTNLKHLHKTLMRHSDKDAWHRGDFKQHSNVVEANNPDGSKRVVFQTTDPGFATSDSMSKLVDWYNNDKQTTPIIKAAVFVYDFLSIHAFQDGNGRLSRLLGTLLLLKYGYSWIQYVSFEHEIESRKTEYYRVLMECQQQRPGEEVSPWVDFFVDCMLNIQQQLSDKLETQKKSDRLAPREKMIYSFVENHPGSGSGEIAEKLDIPLPTVKRILSDMVNNKQLLQIGVGKATNYMIEGSGIIKKDLAMRFTNENRKNDFVLKNQSAFLEITKIILTPKFEWKQPSEWGKKLINNGLHLKITCVGFAGMTVTAPFISLGPDPYQYQPVFELSRPYNIPEMVWQKVPFKKDFPMHVRIELEGSVEQFEFDMMVVYDEG